MIVSELIEKLQSMPQDIVVYVNDESNGVLHEVIEDTMMYDPGDPIYDDLESVVLTVNPLSL